MWSIDDCVGIDGVLGNFHSTTYKESSNYSAILRSGSLDVM